MRHLRYLLMGGGLTALLFRWTVTGNRLNRPGFRGGPLV